MREIRVIWQGDTISKYETNVIPQTGEFIELYRHKQVDLFEVKRVVHAVVQMRPESTGRSTIKLIVEKVEEE